ncbi:unnamed protein product [Phytophthora lilii]|uniref:Unnamed protein product n=1 Tax=Phytophthora lilii TaxID=2077276 RepID=A0A9W6YJP7_9STRA|nr:unnamed protein product [Phytophthora lilii]
MDAILARVGVSDAQLRRHCEAAALDELRSADQRVQDVVAALQQALKVVRASRELHPSLVLNDSEQVQTSFRRLGDSFNQIGPLLRLLHRDMGRASAATTAATSTATTAASPPARAAAVTVPKRSAPGSSSSTDSEYEPSSDDDEAEVVEVVEVTPSETRNKRKAATVDLSESPTPTKTLKEDAAAVQASIAKMLKEIRSIRRAEYTVTTHKEFASYVKNVFATDKVDGWQPRDDQTLAQLLDEMETGLSVFNESAAQTKRRKAIAVLKKEMTASSFVPRLDLTSLELKKDPRVATRKPSGRKELNRFLITANKIRTQWQNDNSTAGRKEKKYFQPLLQSISEFFAAVAVPSNDVADTFNISSCNKSLKLLSQMAEKGVRTTRNECAQVEELLYFIRFAMSKCVNFSKKATTM